MCMHTVYLHACTYTHVHTHTHACEHAIHTHMCSHTVVFLCSRESEDTSALPKSTQDTQCQGVLSASRSLILSFSGTTYPPSSFPRGDGCLTRCFTGCTQSTVRWCSFPRVDTSKHHIPCGLHLPSCSSEGQAAAARLLTGPTPLPCFRGLLVFSL